MDRARPQVGDAAPDTSDLQLFDQYGRRADLSEAWGEGPAVLPFLRYFGCPFCQLFVRRLSEARPRFDEAGLRVVLIGQGSVGQASAFSGPRRVPYDVLVDPHRSAYAAFGLSTGGAMQVAGPAVIAKWVAANATPGVRQRGLADGSYSQLPGTFVVGTDRIVRFAHRNRHAADDPSIADVLAAAAR